MTHRHFGIPIKQSVGPSHEDRVSFYFWSAFIISVFAIPLLCAAVIRWFQ